MRAETLTTLRPKGNTPLLDVKPSGAKTSSRKNQSARAFRIALFLLAIGTVGSAKMRAQAKPAGIGHSDLQVGLGFSTGPHYGGSRYYGGGIYATYDFTEHWGIEADFRQVNTSASNKLYERTYEIGGRYVRHYFGFVNPYGKVLIGRGVCNFANDSANLAYNIGVLGGGVDFNLSRHFNARADYEYQHWKGFPNGALTPQVVTAGIAYRFK